MITFGNGIAFSYNFDMTERESRETYSLKFTCRGDVPFHLAKLLGLPLTQVSCFGSIKYLLVYLCLCCPQWQVGDVMNFCLQLLKQLPFYAL